MKEKNNKSCCECCKINWEKGYLRTGTNLKVVVSKFLKGLTKSPLKVENGGTKLTYQELKKEADGKIKQHLEIKKKQWGEYRF